MADLTNGSGVYQTYDNSGTGVAELGDNKAGSAGNGNGPRTVVVELNNGGNVSQSELDGFIFSVGNADVDGDADSDAFTIAGIEGTANDASGSMFAILQGTGAVDTAANAYGTGLTVSVVADFGLPGQG